MREAYIFGSLLLGAAAVFGTLNVVKYDHSPSVKIEKDISYQEPERAPEPEPIDVEPQNSEPIYAKNAFDQYRGDDNRRTEQFCDSINSCFI